MTGMVAYPGNKITATGGAVRFSGSFLLQKKDSPNLCGAVAQSGRARV